MRRDVAAGLSSAGLLFPEAVAYAGIAGLPPRGAIAAAVVGGLVYAAVGRSRFAVVSTTSSSAAIIAAIIAAIPVADERKAGLAVIAVAIAGAMFIVARIARLGLLTGFIARPVLRGFALGLATTIVLRQIPAIVDVSIGDPDMTRFVPALLGTIPDWRVSGIAVALVSLVFLRWARRFPLLPGAFVLVIVASSLSLALNPAERGLPVVGRIDMTLTWSEFTVPDLGTLTTLAQLSLPLALILFAESWGTMRALALRRGDAIAPDRELVALGLANLAAAAVRGLPVGAGFSAGSANEAAGAESRLAGVVACVGLAALAAFAGPLIAALPRAVLAAIVISALAHALDLAPIARLRRIGRDFWVAVGAAVGVVLFGVVAGMTAAIAFSIGALLRRLALPQIARLGRLPDTRDFVDLARHPEAIAPEGIGVWRPSEPLFFGNAERILATIARAAVADPSVRVIVLSLEESFDLDSTALDALTEADERWAAGGRRLRLARARDPLRDLLRAAGAEDLERRASYSVDDAVASAAAELARTGAPPASTNDINGTA